MRAKSDIIYASNANNFVTDIMKNVYTKCNSTHAQCLSSEECIEEVNFHLNNIFNYIYFTKQV